MEYCNLTLYLNLSTNNPQRGLPRQLNTEENEPTIARNLSSIIKFWPYAYNDHAVYSLIQKKVPVMTKYDYIFYAVFTSASQTVPKYAFSVILFQHDITQSKGNIKQYLLKQNYIKGMSHASCKFVPVEYSS